MDVPAFPTDSLYKFMALAGLAGIFLVPKYYLSQWSDAKQQVIAVYVATRSLVAETKSGMYDIKRIGQEADDLKETGRKIGVDVDALTADIDKAKRRRRLTKAQEDDIERKTAALDDRLKEFDDTRRKSEDAFARIRKEHLRILKIEYELKGKRLLIADLTRSLKAFEVTFWVLDLISWNAAVFGFALWYWLVQRHQDALVRAQAGRH